MSADIRKFDLVIVGGGINGAGIARDAALRGLKVLLLEKKDFGSGTSSWSSRLIHGGLRYLEYGEIPLVFESLHERRRLRMLAPHLVSRLRLVIPIYRRSKRSKLLIRLGMIAYDLLSIGKKIPRHKMLSREALVASEPGLDKSDLIGGAQYYDAQIDFAERLVLENVLAARESGAEVRNYCSVIGINVREGTVRGVQYVDRRDKMEHEVAARVVINAGGPWVDRVLATVNRELPRFMGGTKGSHIVVGKFSGAPSAAFYVEAAADGRPFFIIPWNRQYLIGTTDIRYSGDPGDVQPSEAEVDYLLDETNRVFPTANLTRADIHFAYAGVRPLPRRDKGPESAITRKHIIFKHRKEARGLISIIGGKLTTFRNLSEQAVDVTVKILGSDVADCATRTTPFPGAVDLESVRTKLLGVEGLSTDCSNRLLAIYGSRALQLLATVTAADDIDYIDDARTILAAEVGHAIHVEMAVELTDIVHRRMMLGLSFGQGAEFAESIASIAAEHAGWDAAEKARQLTGLDEYNKRLQIVAEN